MDKVYPYYIETNGFAETIKSNLLEFEDIIVFFDGRNIICENQVKMALFRAFRSKEENKTIAKQFNIEILLHLAGTHQIKIALDLYDVNKDTELIVVFQKKSTRIIENAIAGFPKISPNPNTIEKMKIRNLKDPCKEIISRGARFVLDYE